MTDASFQPSPLNYFSTLVESDHQFPLLEAAASIAQDEHPELDLQSVQDDLDLMLAKLKRRIAPDTLPIVRLRTLNQLFYQELNFSPAVNDYYSPANSYLHAVIKSRRGIPISLAVIWLELAQGIGLNARGVSFPGHFMLKVSLPKGQVVMDPLTGQSLSREDLLERLEPFRRKSGLVGDFEMPLGLYLQAAGGRDIVSRMLRNLKEVHGANDDLSRLVAVLNRLIVLNPGNWGDRRDRGFALAELGQATQAIEDLQAYLKHAEDALDLDAVAEVVSQLRLVGS